MASAAAANPVVFTASELRLMRRGLLRLRAESVEADAASVALRAQIELLLNRTPGAIYAAEEREGLGHSEIEG